jgi:hypothetical protein
MTHAGSHHYLFVIVKGIVLHNPQDISTTQVPHFTAAVHGFSCGIQSRKFLQDIDGIQSPSFDQRKRELFVAL